MTRTGVERLRLFCDRVDALERRRAVTENTIAASFTVNFSPEDGVTIETNLGDEEDVRSLLLEVRKFLSAREPVDFYGIANLVEQLVTDDVLKQAGRDNRVLWKRTLGGNRTLHIGGINYTPEHCWNLVVNGEYFHNDAGLAGEFEALQPTDQDFVLFQVSDLVVHVVNILRAERNLIREAFARDAVSGA